MCASVLLCSPLSRRAAECRSRRHKLTAAPCRSVRYQGIPGGARFRLLPSFQRDGSAICSDPARSSRHLRWHIGCYRELRASVLVLELADRCASTSRGSRATANTCYREVRGMHGALSKSMHFRVCRLHGTRWLRGPAEHRGGDGPLVRDPRRRCAVTTENIRCSNAAS